MKSGRIQVSGLAALLVVGLLVAHASPAGAVGAIQFRKIQYDPPFADDRSNASLNAEYVQIKNTATHTINLHSWKVTDAQNHTYTFGSFNLGAGKTVTLHTGHGTNTSTNRYWNSSNYIWNNSGDKATMKRPDGTTSDTCAWTSLGAGYKNC
jgi:hypothetical protein